MILDRSDLIKAMDFVREAERQVASKDKALVLAEATKRALNQLSQLNIVITPDRFAIWFYAFLILILKGIFNPSEDEILKAYLLTFNEMKGKKDFRPIEIEKSIISKETEETLDVSKMALQEAIGVIEKYTKQLAERENSLNVIKTMEELNKTIELLTQEIKILQKTNMELKEELNKSIRKMEVLKERLRDLQEKSQKDPLTSLLNRAKFEIILEKHLKDLKNNKVKTFSIAMLDIDNFKKLNDVFGHPVGDEFLKRCVGTIIGELRSSDLAFRYGGEEFAIIISEAELKEAIVVCERLRRKIEEIKVPTEMGVAKTTVSIGIAEAKRDDTTKSIVDRADKALYLAKRDGKNCIRTEEDVKLRKL